MAPILVLVVVPCTPRPWCGCILAPLSELYIDLAVFAWASGMRWDAVTVGWLMVAAQGVALGHSTYSAVMSSCAFLCFWGDTSWRFCCVAFSFLLLRCL